MAEAVLYDGNTSTGGTAPVDASSPYAPGATVTVKALGDLTKTYYRFTGWNTAANGSGTARAVGSTFAMGATPVTLYAQWAAEDTDIETLGQKVTMEIPQGCTYSKEFPIVGEDGLAIDVSDGYTAKLEARLTPDDDAVIALDDTDGLTMGNGTITATLANTATAALTFTSDITYWLVLTRTDTSKATLVAAGPVKLLLSYVALA